MLSFGCAASTRDSSRNEHPAIAIRINPPKADGLQPAPLVAFTPCIVWRRASARRSPLAQGHVSVRRFPSRRSKRGERLDARARARGIEPAGPDAAALDRRAHEEGLGTA